MNEDIIKIIGRLAQIADLRGELNKAKSYAGAILGLRALRWKIRDNPERLKTEKIQGVGKGIRNKLIEYATTGTIQELIELENSKSVVAYTELSKIAGAGPKTVADWIRKGIFSIADLRKKLAVGEVELNTVQKYGLTYYGDLNERIPRVEVEMIGNIIIALVKKLDPSAICEITGSYRRGASESGDIDIITTGIYSLENLVGQLKKDPNFIATFMAGSERTTFIYKSPVSGKVRQIDILLLKKTQFWAGILYFTGSWEFNAAMRGYAKSRGYLLNQRGLFKIRGKTETLIKVGSEKEIFDILGLTFVEPSHRIDSADVVPL